ncbi:hypothetical protein [Streptomyces sp. NPDC058157]|uniref:hypothetical protein n=1 Tax=Streptomyces sp. NPDC058157 TaxID=3346360 RepID=UPI0036E31C50
MRGRHRAAAAGCAAAVALLAGCGGSGAAPGPAQPTVLSGAGVCPGGILNPGAVRGIETVTGATRFQPPEEGRGAGVQWVAGVLVRGYATAGASLGGEACLAVPVDGAGRRRLSLGFAIQSEEQRVGEHSESGRGHYWEYDLGRSALAISRQAKLFFDCASARLAGLARAVPVETIVSVSDGSEGDQPALREANLTVAHSAALAMARELGCKDDGGLPERLLLRQTAARTVEP